MRQINGRSNLSTVNCTKHNSIKKGTRLTKMLISVSKLLIFNKNRVHCKATEARNPTKKIVQKDEKEERKTNMTTTTMSLPSVTVVGR